MRDTPDALTLERLSPKTYEWALAAGLIEKSLISGTSGYSIKITTKNSLGQRALFVGCWVTQKIVSENVNGAEVIFAQGAYKINDAVKDSPFMSLAVCIIKKKKQFPAYAQGDHTIQYESHPSPCKTTQWSKRLPSLAALERQTAFFKLRKAPGKKGYVRSVGFKA